MHRVISSLTGCWHYHLASAWQRAQDRERWRRTVEMATLQAWGMLLMIMMMMTMMTLSTNAHSWQFFASTVSLFKLLSGQGSLLVRKGDASLPRHPHWASDTRILTHSPAQNHTLPLKLSMNITWANLIHVFFAPTYVWIYHPGHLYSWKPSGGWGSAPNPYWICAPFDRPHPRARDKHHQHSRRLILTALG